jgi:phosphonoacetaldehyde hydrolase
MDFFVRRTYVGPLKAAIFDWAGTTVDFGCFAPVVTFCQVFAQHGVTVTSQQARMPMGLEKKDHIRAIARMAPVAQQWEATHGHTCTEADIDALYAAFIPLQLACLADYADLIPGTLETIAACRQRGMRIGSTTGYSSAMMEVLLPEAGRRGYAPDTCVCPDTVPSGRPHPWMCLRNAIELQVYPLAAIVKIGDTLPDIEEGLNAGMWTIGVVLSGNEVGLTEAELSALEPSVRTEQFVQVVDRMRRAGAHYVVATIADVPPVLDEIERHIKHGEQP